MLKFEMTYFVLSLLSISIFGAKKTAPRITK